jgi:hypothetical protein
MTFGSRFPTFLKIGQYVKKHVFDEVLDKNIFYVYLLAAYPILFLYAKNWSYLSTYDLISPLLWSLVFALFLLAAVNLAVRNSLKSSLIVSMLLIMFFSYGHIYEYVKDFRVFDRHITHGLLLSFLFAVFLLCVACVLILSRAREYFARFMKSLSVMLFILISFELSTAVISDVQEYFTTVRNNTVTDLKIAPKNRAAFTNPDIYYIILDSYSGEKALRDFYGFDNSEFTGWLKKEGFVVPEDAKSNYCQTALSLPSSLNMQYIDDLINIVPLKSSMDRSPLKRLMAVNAVSKFLKSRGYTIVKFIFGYSITDAFSADITDQPEGIFFLHEFTNHIANTTMLIAVQDFIVGEGKVTINIRRIMSMIDGLPIAAVKFRSPKFVFAHILCPHPPFVFDKNGPITKYIDTEMPDAGTPGFDAKKSDYKNGYLGQVEFLNKNIRITVDKIIKNSKMPPIIIIQADHGSGLSYYVDVEKTNLNDRFSILNAYYLPYGGNALLYKGITPVNSFRCIMNYYFGTKLKMLPDRNFFTSGNYPFQFIEITDKLMAADK